MISEEMISRAHAEYHRVLGDPNRSDPMRAALLAALGENYVVVKKEPTREMVLAGGQEVIKLRTMSASFAAIKIYCAMLSAATSQNGGEK